MALCLYVEVLESQMYLIQTVHLQENSPGQVKEFIFGWGELSLKFYSAVNCFPINYKSSPWYKYSQLNFEHPHWINDTICTGCFYRQNSFFFFLFRFGNSVYLGKYRVMSISGIFTYISLAQVVTDHTKSKLLPWKESTDLFLTTLFSPHFFSITITKAVRFLKGSCKRSMVQAAVFTGLLIFHLLQNKEPTNKNTPKNRFFFVQVCQRNNFTKYFTSVKLYKELIINSWMIQCVSMLRWGIRKKSCLWGTTLLFSLGFGAQAFVGIALRSTDEKQYIGAGILADVASRLH